MGSQSDLHKSVHQFGIDCFAQQNQRFDSIPSPTQTQFIWAKFPSGLIFPYWVVVVFGSTTVVGGCRRRTTVVVLVVLVVVFYYGGRRYCCATSRHSQLCLNVMYGLVLL